MIKTKIVLWKTIEANGTLSVKIRVRVKFLLFYSEPVPTDPWCNMLSDFTWKENIWGGNLRWTSSFEQIVFIKWKQNIKRTPEWLIKCFKSFEITSNWKHGTDRKDTKHINKIT